jgi:hypothetical protein
MLETNNPYMFGPSTSTASTATSQPPPSNSLANGNSSLSRPHGLEREHHVQQKRPVHYYPQQPEEEQPEVEEADKGYATSYNNNRFSSSNFGRHHHLEESQPHLNYTYKSNTNHASKVNTTLNNHHTTTTTTTTTTHHHHSHHHINQHHQHHTPHYLDNHKLNNYSRPTLTNKQPLYPQQQAVKREPSPNMLSSPSLIKNSIDVVEDWYEHSGSKKISPETSAETGDNKKMKRRKEMNAFIEELNQDFLQNKER